jgi:chromosome partitioning protein
MPVISIATQKGGTAKTTTAINLGAGLRRQGYSVLLIDSDPQANLSFALGVSAIPDRNLYTKYKKEIMGQVSDLRQAIVRTSTGLPVVPSTSSLGNIEQELVSKLVREQTFRKRVLRDMAGEYDFVIIDCPPAFGMLTINALVASDQVIVPLQGEILPKIGVDGFLDQLTVLTEALSLNIQVAGFLLTRYSPRKRMNEEIKNSIEDQFPGKVFRSFIHTDIRLAAAQKKGLDIFSYAPGSVAANDYEQFTDEFLTLLSNRPRGHEEDVKAAKAIFEEHEETIQSHII